MSAFLRLFDFYIFANIHVALATFSLTKITLLSVDIKQNEVPIFIFFATIVAYNFIRLYRKSAIKSWFSSWIDRHKISIVVISLFSIIMMCCLAFQIHIRAILSLVPFFAITLFYVVPIRRVFSSNTSLRTVAGIKIFLIAFCWAGVTVVFPILNYDVTISTDAIIVFIQRFLFVLAITIPFDLRDLSHDNEDLKTLPQLIGVIKSKKLGLLFLMFFLGLEFFVNDLNQLRITFAIALISLLFLIRSNTSQSKYYSAFFVEGIPIVWLLLVLL